MFYLEEQYGLLRSALMDQESKTQQISDLIITVNVKHEETETREVKIASRERNPLTK